MTNKNAAARPMAAPAIHVFAILALAMDVIITPATANLALASLARAIKRATL